jgi:hypothetical protein
MIRPVASRLFALGSVIGLTVLAASCLRQQQLENQPSPDVDRKLSLFSFIEDGDIAALIVSTRATTQREKADYMPLEICIANRGLKKMSLTRESFTLLDEKGNRYPAANPSELLKDYPYLDFDRKRFSELFGLVSTRFSAFELFPSKFSPTRGGRLIQDRVEIPRSGVLFDFLYFPMPVTGLKGHRFELFLDTPELEDPLFVKFTVP